MQHKGTIRWDATRSATGMRVGYADFADKLDVAELDAVLRGDTALKQLPRSKN